MDLSSLQGVLVIVGPIVLALAIIWAMFRNHGNRREMERTEAATRELYERQDREDKARDHGGIA